MAVIRRKTKSKEEIARRAHLGNTESANDLIALARSHNINTTPLDIEALIKVLGIKLKKEPMEGDNSGSLKHLGDCWLITVNSLHHPTRQRFTMAHELAHYILHRNDHSEFNDTILFRNGEVNQQEYEANNFAGELLMPETEFRAFISKRSTSVDDLAEYFNASPLAVRVRAKQLNLRGHGL